MDSRYSNRNYPSSNRGYSGNSGYPKKKKKKKKYRIRIQPRFYFLLAIFVVVIALMIVAVKALTASDSGTPQSAENTQKSGGFIAELFKTPTPSPTPSPTPTPTPSPTPPYDIPHAVDSTQPSVYGLSTAVEVDGTKVDTYEREEKIEFLPDETYTSVLGITTFRGNNYRDSASYGTASIVERKLTEAWMVTTGELQ